MPLELRQVDFADGDELAILQATGNADNELLKAFHPGLSYEDSLAGIKERWPAVCNFIAWYTVKVVDTETGKAAAVSRWMMPPEHKEQLPKITGTAARPPVSSGGATATNTNQLKNSGVPEGLELPPRKPPTTLDREVIGAYGAQEDEIMEREIGERDCISKRYPAGIYDTPSSKKSN